VAAAQAQLQTEALERRRRAVSVGSLATIFFGFDENTTATAQNRGFGLHSVGVAQARAQMAMVPGISGNAAKFTPTTWPASGYRNTPASGWLVPPCTVNMWVKPDATHQVEAQTSSGTSGTSGQRYVINAQHGQDSTQCGIGVSVSG
jgi:hypothetical protein